MFLFDTDHIEILEWQTQPEYGQILQRMASRSAADFYFSIVSLQEQVLGANVYISRSQKVAGVIHGYGLLAKILDMFCRTQVLGFDSNAAQVFGALSAQKVRCGTHDLRISAIALVNGFTVLTRNLKDFRLVPGLRSEDWTV